MTDSLPRSQQRPPDGNEAESGWGTSVPSGDEAAADAASAEDHEEQPGFPEGPKSPADGGD